LKYLLLLFLMFLGPGFRFLLRLRLPLASEESPRDSLLRATDVHLEGLEVSHHELGAGQPYRNRKKRCQLQNEARATELKLGYALGGNEQPGG
jgi:hypothetical protein